MDTKTTTKNGNLNALLNNAIFTQSARINEIKNLQLEIETDENFNFERTLRIAEHFKIALLFFASEEAKNMAKECEIKLTNEVLSEIFGYSISQFKRYKAVSKLKNDVIKSYKEQTPKNRGLDSLIKFANKLTSEDTNEESESESESELKVKEENLQIKVGKDNKITIKGKASKEVLTLLIEELKKMMA